jgi:hypothetical protein
MQILLYIVILLYVILFKVLCFHRTQDCQKAQSTCQATRLHWDAHQIMNAVKLLGSSARHSWHSEGSISRSYLWGWGTWWYLVILLLFLHLVHPYSIHTQIEDPFWCSTLDISGRDTCIYTDFKTEEACSLLAIKKALLLSQTLPNSPHFALWCNVYV